jgi:hypothetical protein
MIVQSFHDPQSMNTPVSAYEETVMVAPAVNAAGVASVVTNVV